MFNTKTDVIATPEGIQVRVELTAHTERHQGSLEVLADRLTNGVTANSIELKDGALVLAFDCAAGIASPPAASSQPKAKKPKKEAAEPAPPLEGEVV
jgi:hypothetical protein